LTSACLIPDYWNAIQSDVEKGRIAEALAAQRRLYPFFDALFGEDFPARVRLAFEMLGPPIGRPVAPIGELSEGSTERLGRALGELVSAGVLHRLG
jgi:4-hydroxy-tetrahydrodipicolinate synthase